MSHQFRYLLHAFKWSAATELASRLVQPAVILILARLLTPEDFGVMAAATMVISFSQVFWDAGMGKALIQRQTEIREAKNVAFWTNLALGLLVSSLIFLFAEPIALHIFNDQRVSPVLRVMVVHVILSSLVATHTSLLQKEFQFKRLFWIRTLTVALPACASIPLALRDWSYWALVAGAVTGQAIQLIVVWRTHDWRPEWSFDQEVAREMFKFGAWVGFSALLGWFYLWADSLIIGMQLGAYELGVYRTGNQFVMMLFGVIFAPMLPVLYSHLSKIQTDRARLNATYERVIKASIVAAIPISLVLFSVSSPIGAIIFGDQWRGIGFVIGVMSLTHGVAWIVGANGEVYRSIGKPSYELVVTASSLPVYLLAYHYSIRGGFEMFVWTRFTLAVGATFFHLFLIQRLLRIAIVPILRFLAAISMISLVVLPIENVVSANVADAVAQSFAIASASICMIGTVLYVFRKRLSIVAIFLPSEK